MSAIWTVKKRVSWDFLYLHRTFKYSKMQKHEYHDFFLPILAKLYQERNNDTFIDITDRLTWTNDQDEAVINNLEIADFATINDDTLYDISSFLPSSKKNVGRNIPLTIDNSKKISGKILPLGIAYIENFIEELQRANKKIPPVGFKPNS